MDKAAATLLGLEAVEDWAQKLCRTEKKGRGRQTGCANSREQPRPVADQHEPGAEHCSIGCLLRRNRTSEII